MDHDAFVSYEDIAASLEDNEVIVGRMWELLRQFKQDCRRVFKLRAIREKRRLGSTGPLEVVFYFDATDQVPPPYILAGMIRAQFEFLDFPTTFHVFSWYRDPDSDECTHRGFGLHIAYWRFSNN
ncbi:hypothetical protein [Hymenobacter antarcticus]|uniref:Uncharacterized protein n=1 Tax=Hymenobacter antarcticus TaxID=486270 RepID=A0ABP7PQM0_9BACT